MKTLGSLIVQLFHWIYECMLTSLIISVLFGGLITGIIRHAGRHVGYLWNHGAGLFLVAFFIFFAPHLIMRITKKEKEIQY